MWCGRNAKQCSRAHILSGIKRSTALKERVSGENGEPVPLLTLYSDNAREDVCLCTFINRKRTAELGRDETVWYNEKIFFL